MVYLENKSINKKSVNRASCAGKLPPWTNGMRVMVVIDVNDKNTTRLVKNLTSAGLEVMTFRNSFVAAEVIKSQRFDLFLLDTVMPDISGFELAEIIRNSEFNSYSLIMFISEHSDSENKITGYNLGSSAFIEKPFDVNVVYSQIVNALKTRQLNEIMNKTKESFITMVTHDLKSPINAEIAALELLLKNFGNATEDFKMEIVTDILGAVKYMKNLVENVTNKYKYDNNEVRLNKEKKSIKFLVEECLEEAKYLIVNKCLTITLNYRARTENLFMDYIEIKRVIHNLLVNAVEYTPKNSVIEIDISENKKYLVFSIRNPSRGIPIPNPEQLFDKFVSDVQKSKKISSGLGLYIARKLVEAHGGSINVDVKNPAFVRFVFTLPK